jgi:hypothetical protein
MHVEHPVDVNCNFLCFNYQNACVGFNFREKTKAINCQLTNTTKKRNYKEEGEWTLYLDVDAVSIKLANIRRKKHKNNYFAFIFVFYYEKPEFF